MCDEISRNGLKKIILVNGHGGNNSLLPYFCQLMLDAEKDYMTFLSGFPKPSQQVLTALAAEEDGHAGEEETSTMMAIHPDLAKPERFGDYGRSLERMKAFKEAGLYTGISWYADYPGHFAASKAPFSPEKGEIVIDNHVDFLIGQIRLVKEDDTPTTLYREFHQRARKPENRYP
jgi:creatinine amidohydrolase